MIFRALLISLVFAFESMAQVAPVCQNWNSDSDGDGWGWENGASCSVPPPSVQAAVHSNPVCSATVRDYDGDGWGYEFGQSCRVQPQVQSSAGLLSAPQCGASVVDYDGDGWGYEFGLSCRAQPSTGQQAGRLSVPQCSASVVDFDGDGWGYEYGRSCLVDSEVTGNSSATSLSGGSFPTGVQFNRSTLRRVGGKGDNWCQTWAADGSVITAMDDGDWNGSDFTYHSRLYRVWGDANGFSKSEIQNYPNYHVDGDGWFAYGVVSVNGVLYSLVSKTQNGAWSEGPFRGMKLLRSYDSGNNWYRVDRNNNDRYLGRWDSARELLNRDDMLFFEENGRYGKGKTAYPFSFASFVQSGQDHRASKDGYVYIYSPEGANSHQLLLARVPAEQVGQRSAWQYFSGWNGSTPKWTSNIEARQPNITLPERNSRGEYFGWYSWLPSVVWNPGLQLYVMVNGGTYAGDGLSNSSSDYYDKWMHTKTGSLGLWYSENPYGPWKQFYYNDYWTADDAKNLTYQPKLSPKWMSADGRKMTLIWSDAMLNADGYSHSINYKWNQMEIDIVTSQ